MTTRLYAFAGATRGNVAAIVALLAPVLLFTMGTVVNFSTVHSANSRLQSAADSAALAAARELYLANSRPEILKSVAYSFAMTNLGSQAEGVEFDVEIGGATASTAAAPSVSTEVTVTLTRDFASSLPMPDLTGTIGTLTASATARIAGGGRICAIALTSEGSKAIDISGNAVVHAAKCAVYSNSADPRGLSVTRVAKLSSELACSSGGYDGIETNYEPLPLTDCPAVSDPLSSRIPPVPTKCDHENERITNNNLILRPGVYCGKLQISGSKITLQSGIYVFWNAKVRLDKGSEVIGDNVSLVFIGHKSSLDLKNDSTISLSASEDGPMAGILIYADSQKRNARDFKIESNNAKRMIGTIYLPNDTLTIGGDKNADGVCDPDIAVVDDEDEDEGGGRGGGAGTPGCKANVGEFSDWTALVANKITVTSGVKLVLNTNYAGSDVPVPVGVGPVGGNIALSK
ncbi:pilus assembly protein TadG-related protein [Aurantimonas sp. A2-1-M11]|uniref:pilus assembly protein TadG-related protein n=1 Tax=Aurantimonas sp. A2-1-M11 TaxID=3113712 RepID=UPI002F93574E